MSKQVSKEVDEIEVFLNSPVQWEREDRAKLLDILSDVIFDGVDLMDFAFKMEQKIPDPDEAIALARMIVSEVKIEVHRKLKLRKSKPNPIISIIWSIYSIILALVSTAFFLFVSVVWSVLNFLGGHGFKFKFITPFDE